LVYPPELEIKETTDTASSTSILGIYLAVSQIRMTFQEIRIIATGPSIENQLREVNTICRRSWFIAAHIWNLIQPTGT
jgi:hypothetical protein